MDFYDINRQFNGGGNGGEEGYDYKLKGVPHMYPPMPQMANMMPSMVPVPMMAIRPGAEMDYNRWLNAGGYQQQYRNAFYDPNAYPRPGGNNHEAEQQHANTQERHVYPDDLGDLSPPFSAPNSPRFGPGPPIVTSDRVKGPRGCNLFVFHLPNEITNWDLYLLFRKYGTILSVHTMINKTTGLSKGYGFVSYSAREEAKAAITAMDGFRLGKKRLKVQVKRSQDDPMDPEGGNPDDDEEGPDLEDHQYEGQGFTSGENSAATTRASTPHAQSFGQSGGGGQSGGQGQPQAQMQAQARANSDCSSDSLEQEEHTQGHAHGRGPAHTSTHTVHTSHTTTQHTPHPASQHGSSHTPPSQAVTPRSGQQHAEETHRDGALKMGALSLTPITPKQAEAQHRREAYIVPGAARTPTHASATATATATHAAAHAHAAYPTHSTHTAHSTHAIPSPRNTTTNTANTTHTTNTTAGYGHRADREGYVQSAPTVSGQYEPEIGPRKVTGCIARERIDLLGRICIDLGY